MQRRSRRFPVPRDHSGETTTLFCRLLARSLLMDEMRIDHELMRSIHAAQISRVSMIQGHLVCRHVMWPACYHATTATIDHDRRIFGTFETTI